jgi:hypothetical protein
MELTKDEAVRLFREHWKWLAETGGESADKEYWLFVRGYRVFNHCFLCEYTLNTTSEYVDNCDNCPIDWGGSICCGISYFGGWLESNTPEERKRLAKIISELPEKEG